MKKKLLTVIAVASVTLGLVACGAAQTETPVATATPTPEPIENPSIVLENVETSSIVSVNGGVVLTKDEAGYYAAYNYEGKKIELNGNYNILLEGISAEGQFALSNGEVAYIFDKEGNVLLELSAYTNHEWVGRKEVWISISENKVLYYMFEKYYKST